MDIQKRIKDLLDKRCWTVYRLAQEADMPQSTLSNLFNRYNEPTISTLEIICKGFGITLAQFFTNESDTTVTLTAQQREILDHWSKLDENQKRIMLEFFKTL